MGVHVAVMGSLIEGMTTGEHHGHYDGEGNPEHPDPCPLTGEVTEGTPKLVVGGVPVALAGAPTSEDDCCGAGAGTLGDVNHKIHVGGVPVQAVGDPTVPHNGAAEIVTGSDKLQTV